ncbi:MAG: 4-diphosphocytidyl-2-C-methyl-D-erythritol kinase [Chlamydiales bacterium]|nr:4-diphosphocytidyl-2-C-methyl-D-erythritol kinase [Chlamydiales bacterium]MCH9619217.1 4-diphosphocytidyl-2-C-methyl-D-erythritol kinase [Chlamydiales bacterium]MCH9622479.1 4-diphosphocytidyl-2-C-methyl-D-erythritol kinase [Chlamydiales bacterium]
MKLFSPAKVNLFLRILRRREDGFHEIASLFQAIDLGDTLFLELSSCDQFTTNSPDIPLGPSNLVFKALKLFREKTALSTPVKIHLEKKIPTEAGLGGGSSNAATTLWGLNALHDFPLSEKELQLWSAELGSDVPFFFSSGTAYCQGRGEQIKNLKPLSLQPFWLFKPPSGLSTQQIYQALDLKMCSTVDPEELLASFYLDKPIYHNDLESPAFLQDGALARLKSTFEEAYANVVMTGSGTAFVCTQQHTPLAFDGWSWQGTSKERREGEWW